MSASDPEENAATPERDVPSTRFYATVALAFLPLAALIGLIAALCEIENALSPNGRWNDRGSGLRWAIALGFYVWFPALAATVYAIRSFAKKPAAASDATIAEEVQADDLRPEAIGSEAARDENPYASPTLATVASRTRRRGLGMLVVAVIPLAGLTFILMLLSGLENSQYPDGGTLLGTEIRAVRQWIRILFVVWFTIAVSTIAWTAAIVHVGSKRVG